MPIDVTCQCGRTSSVPDQFAGKKGRCPACGVVMPIPMANDPFVMPDLGITGDPDEPAEPAQLPPRSAVAPARSPLPSPPEPPEQPAPDPPKPRGGTIPVRCSCAKVNHFNSSEIGGMAKCVTCGKWLKVEAPPLPYGPTIQRVHLVDAEMPFGSMCWFIMKWTFAALPTAIVLVILWVVLNAILQNPGFR